MKFSLKNLASMQRNEFIFIMCINKFNTYISSDTNGSDSII